MGITNQGTTHPWRIEPVGDRPFTTERFCLLRHNLAGHPLLALDRLRQLANVLLDQGHCRFMPNGTAQDARFEAQKRPIDGRSVDEIFRDIERPGSWIAMYNVEADASYRDFLWETMRSLEPLLAEGETVFDVRGFIFVSAPPSATPFHIDRENNFWLQVRGRKTMGVWDRTDRDVVSAEAVERFILHRTLKDVVMTDDTRRKCTEFDCGPGDGVYFPSTTPHTTRSDRDWVRPGDGISISIGVNFYTNLTRRAAHVHHLNSVLRRLGVRPSYPGESPWVDQVKFPFGSALTACRRRLRGFKTPPGF